ncbi:hypothetical protein DSUL_260039 [Desulfovibrionales bacterium]
MARRATQCPTNYHDLSGPEYLNKEPTNAPDIGVMPHRCLEDLYI